MSKDLLFGLLLGLPLYAIVLFLFRDIIIKRFISKLTISTETGAPFTTQEFRTAVNKDLLNSYKLLLILRDEFHYMITEATDKLHLEIYNEKLADLNYVINCTEQMFDDAGSDSYKEVREDIDKIVKNRKLF